MGVVFVLCGKTGSGKSTLAKFISNQYAAVSFSADAFMLKLFGEINDRNMFDAKLAMCKSLIYDISDNVLQYANVVFDFGFWTKEERNYIINRFSGHKVIIIYMKLDDAMILERLSFRNSHLGEGEYYINENTFFLLSTKFEEPDQTETYIQYKNIDNLVLDLKKWNL